MQITEDIRYVPYTQPGEPRRKAGIVPAHFPPADRLTDRQLELIRHLSAAADVMNDLFRRQFCRDTEKLFSLLRRLQPYLSAETNTAVEEYLTVLTMQNGPWSMLPRKNHLLQADRGELQEAARNAGQEEELRNLERYLFSAVPMPGKAEFYPEDLSEEEYQAMDPAAGEVNTALIRDEQGRPRALRNEELYREHCRRAVEHLRKARTYADDPDFVIYLDAKIEELTTGSPEARRIADYHWIKHDSPVDIILSTALEVYLDDWRNVKGAACGLVAVKDPSRDELLSRLKEAVPELERSAPWTWRRENIDPASLPKIKFVDVYNWTGDYITMPATVLAQSLPNDEWVGKHIGTVNMVYSNTGEARHALTGRLWQQEFLPSEAAEEYESLMYEGGQLHSVLHEIGHTTGRQDPDHPGRPADYLQSEYSAIEEARAELFGMWSAEEVKKQGIVDEKSVKASHYHMLIALISALKFEPEQAHNKARNMIFHRLLEDGAIVQRQEGGKSVFDFDFERLSDSVGSMLAEVADIKAAGDKEGAQRLRERFCFVDPRREEIEQRTAGFPQGTAIRFPRFTERDGKLTGELQWPEYVEQAKFAT